LTRITSRSALGASPMMASTSAASRAICSATTGSATPCTGTEALVNDGLPARTTRNTRHQAATAQVIRSCVFRGNSQDKRSGVWNTGCRPMEEITIGLAGGIVGRSGWVRWHHYARARPARFAAADHGGCRGTFRRRRRSSSNSLGAKVMKDVTEVMGAGWLSIIVDPTGACLGFWKPKTP